MESLKPTIQLVDLGVHYGEALAWIVANEGRHELATQLTHRLTRFKLLTAHQLEAVQRIITEAAEHAPRVTSFDPDGVGKVLAAFNLAIKSGVERPSLRLAVFIFTPARATGPNAGALHIIDAEHIGFDGEPLFLAKIVFHDLLTSRDCTVERRQQIVQACVDPVASAIAYGHDTGICACCGKELKEKTALTRGIHTSCLKKWFGA